MARLADRTITACRPFPIAFDQASKTCNSCCEKDGYAVPLTTGITGFEPAILTEHT